MRCIYPALSFCGQLTRRLFSRGNQEVSTLSRLNNLSKQTRIARKRIIKRHAVQFDEFVPPGSLNLICGAFLRISFIAIEIARLSLVQIAIVYNLPAVMVCLNKRNGNFAWNNFYN